MIKANKAAIRRRLREAKMTQNELAEKMGISSGALSKLLSTSISLHRAKQIRDILGPIKGGFKYVRSERIPLSRKEIKRWLEL